MIAAELTEGEMIVAFGSMVAALLAVLLPILISTLKHSRKTYDQVNRVDEIIDSTTAPNLRQIINEGFRRNDEAHKKVYESIGETRGELRAHINDPNGHKRV